MNRLPRLIALALTAAVLSGCVSSRSARSVPPVPPAPPGESLAHQNVEKLPAPPPSWEARTVAPNARDIAESHVIVAPGDTLRSIGARTGVGAEAIARANALDDPDRIRIGQRLRIPGGRYHIVQAGESGIAIARAYGVPWAELVRLNALAEPFVLRVGQGLLLPPTSSVAAMTLEQRAAAFSIDIDDILTGGEPALAQNAAPPPTSVVTKSPATSGGFDGRFIWPVNGRVISRFGPAGAGRVNDGVNIAVPVGTPVLAAADGVVVYAGTGISVFGGLILLRHADGWSTAYGHAGELLVKRGDTVRSGQIIARSGQSGYVDSPQLHFQIRRSRTPVNPLTRLPTSG